MKKIMLRTISMILVIALFCATNIRALATEKHATETKLEEIFNMGDTKIYYYEEDNGDRIFLQYVDGVLTQKNTIPFGQHDIVEREFYGKTRNITKDKIRPSDYTIVDEGENVEYPSPRAIAGIIKYRAVLGTGIINYGLQCSNTYSTKTSTYTIKSYVGKVVDIVTILISSTNLIASIGTTTIKRICISAGIEIIGGKITKALSTTVACQKTTYKWTLVDTTQSSHYANVYGYKYKVTDSDYYTNNTYYEGYVPKDWGTQELAVWFHNEMFGYTSWEVVGWE